MLHVSNICLIVYIETIPLPTTLNIYICLGQKYVIHVRYYCQNSFRVWNYIKSSISKLNLISNTHASAKCGTFLNGFRNESIGKLCNFRFAISLNKLISYQLERAVCSTFQCDKCSSALPNIKKASYFT